MHSKSLKGLLSLAVSPKKARAKGARDRIWLELVEFKRDRILAVAADLFHEQGYRETSVELIAAQLGATKPFIYYHFGSKLDLLNEICQRGTREALDIAIAAMSSEGTPTERLSTFVRDFTKSSLDNHKFVMIYFREMIHLKKVDADRINRMRKDIDRNLTKLLLEGEGTGEFAIEDPFSTALAISGMASFPVAWYRGEGRFRLENFYSTLTTLTLRMVGAAKNSDETS